MFRPKHTAVIATAAIAMALGGAGVAIAASGGDDSKSSGAGTTATTRTGAIHDRRRSYAPAVSFQSIRCTGTS